MPSAKKNNRFDVLKRSFLKRSLSITIVSKPRSNNIVGLTSRDRPQRRQLVKQLFDRHARALRVFLHGRSVPEDEIEDFVQELFTRLMGAQRLEEKMAAASGSNRSYLLTMANNLIVDKQRKSQVRKAYATEQQGFEYQRMDERTPERIVAAQLELEATKAVILDMRPHWRAVLVLQRFHNMSYEDIALHMGVTKMQAENYMRQALRRIRKARRKIEAAGERSC